MIQIKKLISGFIAGVLIMIGGSVIASSDAVGAVFAKFNVVINGNKVELQNEPLVLNGTTYVPLRELSNLLSKDVNYEVKSRTISISDQKQTVPKTDTNQTTEVVGKVEGVAAKGLAGKYVQDDLLDADSILSDLANGHLDINSEDSETGENLLILAVKYDKFHLAWDLLKKGISVNHQDGSGKTAMHYTAQLNRQTILSVLAGDFKADVSIVDSDGKRPIEYTDEGSRINRAIRTYEALKLYEPSE